MPRQELLHNFDTSSKPTASFRGALRTADGLKLLRFRNGSELLFNVTADPSEAAPLDTAAGSGLPWAAARERLAARMDALAAEAVPCWGGTGTAPLPAGFDGDCDSHPPNMECQGDGGGSPPAYYPGWCKPPTPAPPTPPTPPPPPPPAGGCASKPPTAFCSFNQSKCATAGAAQKHVQLYAGTDAPAACQLACLARDACTCWHWNPESSKPCKVWANALGALHSDQKGENAHVRGTAAAL